MTLREYLESGVIITGVGIVLTAVAAGLFVAIGTPQNATIGIAIGVLFCAWVLNPAMEWLMNRP